MAQVTEPEQYQVFINHRGPDTKDKLASPIYEALVGYGLEVFLDREELVKGGTALREIPNAIKSASVFIAIFSPTYAESHWCLDELHWMWCSLREEKVIYPVFCDVEPNDIRDFEKGCYAKDLDKYQQEGKKEVNEWMVALREVSKKNGFLFKTDKSDYGKFLKDIVDIVIKHVKWNPLEVATHPVGLDEAWKDLQDRNQKCGSKEVVVIAGVSGIGKSTLARHIFNDLSRPVIGQSQFSRACYLCNVRETVDLTSLQRQLYCDLLGKDRNIRNTDEGKTMLQKSLKGLKFLIVFDDVDDGEKLKTVLDIDAVEPGSRIFITSHDKYLYSYSSNTFVYDVQLLEKNHARELFCYHAFRQVNPLEEYADLVDKFLKFCGGLPFLLEVLGQQFRGRLDRTYWEEHLASFFQSGVRLPGVDRVIKKLKWIYASMINETKLYEQLKMFLDVAYFFVGEDQELAIRVLEGLDYAQEAGDCLQSLHQNCLVNFEKDVESRDESKNHGQDIAISEGKHLILPAVLPKHMSKIIMHNQVWILARDIVSDEPPSPYNPLRLSCSIDIEKMLQSQSGSTSWIRGICIRKDRSPPQLPDYINISDLRLLVVEHPIDSSWFRGSRISGNLVWLRWRNSPLTSLPSTILLKDLRVLELESSKDELEGFFEGFFDSIDDETPSELRELNIDLRGEGASSSTSSSAQLVDHYKKTSLVRFLGDIGCSMKELRKIVYKNDTVPQSLPFDFSNLENLRHLDLSGSTNLTTLPNSISQLLQLQHLALRDCINLSIPMHILGKITTLEHIDFKGCAQLVHLPEGISSQRSLRYLNLLETRLTELALNLQPLGKLEQLIIGSASLKELSCSVENLVHLKELILVKCDSLMQIHTPYLERLEIYGSRVPHLPVGIALHKHLKVLTIYSSPIENFALDNTVMDALTNLTLMRTSISEIIIPPGACPRLEIVDLSDNLQLRQVQVFQPTLVKLNLDGCLSLEYLRLAELVHLKCLNINGCGCVETLDVENWGSLEEIRAETCWKLRMREEAWSQMGRLKFFSFSQKFRWDEVREKAGSMEKAKYEMMFQLFMSMTIRMLRPVEEHELEFELEKLNEEVPYLMCFLTSDEGEFTKCNDFMVRFVYTTIKSYETRANETRANETRWFAITSLQSCQEIMAYGTLFENEESLERVGDDDSGELHHVQQTLEGNTMGVSLMLEDEMSSHPKQEMLEALEGNTKGVSFMLGDEMSSHLKQEQLEASSMAQVTEAEQYQVFINHRGPDTKTNVASLIYEALVRYGLSVFLDKEELCKGDTLSPAIRGASSSSSVYIAIFSKNYAQSPWCLNELCWMLKSSHERLFIPIFYDVEPTDLRYIEKGCYADAFHEHQQKGRVSMEVVEGWKKALGEAADIIGLTFKTKESDIGELVEKIVKTVLKTVRLSGYWEGIEKNVSKEVRPEQLKGIEKKLLKEARPGQWENVLKEIRPEQLEVATQVFITYSVPDIKNTLPSLVYYRLANCYGLRVFMDDEENRTEDSPSPAILTAISSASVHIVFFSENYAESLRFLDELCWVLGSSHPCTLIPVFCDVEPDDLRPIDGAFRTHEPKGQVAIEVLERWKEALEKAAATPGHLFKTKESDSGEFLEKIEKNVLEELRWEPLQVAPDVFINHRGPEIKMTLASLIYNRLKICGFRGFHDKKETADTVSPAILSAIRSAPLHITIFSKGYAESRRCLDELSSILRSCRENRSLIIPVFCGVKPDDLRNIDGGCYAQAFNQHQRESGVSMEVAEGWKMALREASEISGLLFQTNESDYGEFLQIFVEIVLNKVKWEAVGVAREVFINHNGPDVNVSLASVIDNRLKICGLRIFQDNNEIHTGDALSTSILSAIRTASLHVVIFSQCYAESRQCLDELTWIFRSSPGSKIIPVFCDVEPIDLRGIGSGRYALAFQKHLHSGKVAREVLDTWKTALRQASDISGLFFKMNESEEGEFVERIVEIVLDGVKREPLEVATHPVGLDQAAEDFQNEILNQNNSIPSKIVGIAGIGGVGKTTLVKYIFNLRRSDFSRSCYLSNIREKMDLLCLQRQLLRDLLGIDEYIINTIEGKRILRDHLQGLQILLVLDGVDHIEQIDSLVDMDALGAGSLILLTSRDKDVLGKSSPTTLLYDVKPLNRRHAKELFCRHAFLQFKPLEGYEYLVQKFLEICGGLPLSLEVIGGLLADNLDKTYWMLQLKKFSKRLPDEILDTLKVSYQSLNKKEKEMYLDIGCFLAGEEIELAVRVLQGSGYTNVRETLESLRIKCLLDFHSEVESNNDINYKYKHPDIFRLIMHNQIRGLARHIAREEFIEFSEHKPFRLSCSNDMNQMLQLQDGSDFSWIRGIRIPKAQDPPQLMNHINIRGVRFLVVEHPIDLSSFRMSGDLVWLRLNNFPSVSIPSTISLANLRVLELHSLGDHNEQLFEGSDELSSESSESNASARGCASASASSSRQPFDVEHDTKFSRNISNTLQHVMPSFSRFLQWTGTFMNKIVLKNMDTLESIPIDFSELKNLRHLDLSGCIHLTKLSNSFSQLKRLQYLALRDCKNLSMPTDILGEISTLEYVDFKGCAQLVHLPTGMARQRSLRYLDLLCTPKLQLSMNLELLGQLEQLRIGSPLLTELPHSVNLLMSLQVLVLIECRGLKSILPREIAGPNIKVLVIQGSPITNFSFEDQGMMHCVMGVLRDFSLRNTSISEICIPGGLYPSLKTVDLSDNIWLTQVKGLSSTLTRLNLQGCRILERLTNLSNLVNLKFLNINRCLGLETLNIEGLISLEEIKAEGCWNLKRIRGLSQRERLNRLQISTSNSVIWNDICKFLTLRPSYGKLSTASFSGMVDVKRVLDNREMRRIMEQFNVKMVDIVSASTTSEFHVKLENLHSQDAILMCFITSGVSPGLFRVRFEASNDGGPTQEYRSLRGSGDGKRLHVFMWTEDSHLFRDYKNYSNIDVYCSRVDVSEFDAEHVERGWMVMVDKDTDFSRVCKEFIVAFT